MNYNKRSKKTPYQKGGHAPCLDDVPSSCYKVVVSSHGGIPYMSRNDLVNIRFPFASLKYYVPNGRIANIEPDVDAFTYIGDICNDRPELIIEEIPSDETPGRLDTTKVFFAISKFDLESVADARRHAAGTLNDSGLNSFPAYGGIFLCETTPSDKKLAGLVERAKIDEILLNSTTRDPTGQRTIENSPNALRRREEEFRTRNQVKKPTLENSIKLYSEHELYEIPSFYGDSYDPSRRIRMPALTGTDPDMDKLRENLLGKLQAVRQHTADVYDMSVEGPVPLPYARKSRGGEVVVFTMDHIIKLIEPLLKQRNIPIENCELCVFMCRSLNFMDLVFTPDTPEAIAADKLSNPDNPTRFATEGEFKDEEYKKYLSHKKRSDNRYKDGTMLTQYTTDRKEKRKQNEDWLRRRALGLYPLKNVPDRIQNIYRENHGRINETGSVSYRIQDYDQYGRYTPVWDAARSNLEQRWTRNGQPYNPGTMANIAKGRQLVLRNPGMMSPEVFKQMRDLFIGMQARAALTDDNPYIPVTASQMLAYLSPPQRPSIESVLEAVTPEELENYVIVDRPDADADATKLLLDIQTDIMDSVNDRQCPSHEKIPQPCTTPETSYKKQSLIFYPDKNLTCPKAATKKFEYLTALCKESGNSAGGSKKRKRRKTRRRTNMRRRKTRRRNTRRR